MSDIASKNRSFTDKMFRRLLVPALISTAGLAFGDVADALFVGIRIGKVGLATMSLVAPVYMIFNVLIGGIAIGASVKYTQALARGKAKEGVEVFSHMLAFALIVSVLLGAAGLLGMPYVLKLLGAGAPRSELWNYTKEYLEIMFLGEPLTFLYFLLYYCVRCDDAEKLASVGYTVGYLTDVAASAVFILVFKWDVRGAIYATVLGKAVGVCIFCFHFTRKWAILRFRFGRPKPMLIFSTLRTGMASSFGYFGQFAALLIVNNVLLRIGGSVALAQFNVVQDVSYLALAIYTALGDTVQPLSGTFCAERNNAAVKRVMSLTVFIGIAVGGAVAALFAVFAPTVCSLFGLTGGAVTSGAFAVRMFCLSVVPAGLSLVFSASFQSIGREKLVFLINQLRTFVCFTAFALLLSRFGIKWFWLTFLCAEAATLIIWVPVARRTGQPVSDKVFTYLLDSNSGNISELLEQAEAFCEENGANPKQIYFVTMCVEEVCVAIMENAFRKDGDEYIQMTVCLEEDGTVILHLRDNAVSFNPFAMKTGRDYEDEENLASLGIQLVKTKSKNFFYRRYAGFNTMTVEVE